MPLKVYSREQVLVGLLRDESWRNFLLMVVENFFERFLFLVSNNYLPKLYGLIGRRRDQNLLSGRICVDNLFAEHASYKVVMCWIQLFDNSALVEAEQVDLIIHASECVRIMPDSSGCRKTSLRNKETFLDLLILSAEHLDETIHGSCDHAQSLWLICLPSWGCRIIFGSITRCCFVIINKHNFFLVRLFYLRFSKEVQLLKSANAGGKGHRLARLLGVYDFFTLFFFFFIIILIRIMSSSCTFKLVGWLRSGGCTCHCLLTLSVTAILAFRLCFTVFKLLNLQWLGHFWTFLWMRRWENLFRRLAKFCYLYFERSSLNRVR